MKKKFNIKFFGIILLILFILSNSIAPSLAIEITNQDEYLESLKQLRDNIYNRYKKDVNSQWEWANIGFYEGFNNGIEGGYRKGLNDLPKGLDLYKIIGELDSRAIAGMGSTVAGTVIALTSMGIDCTNLESFEIDGKPFRTRDRKDATNLVKFIYDSNSGGINFCTWGLIALDMGNYSTPADANSTREKLLETILNHKYGSDGFAVDMVAMLMQSLYPYQNDPVYGKRVKEKLENGLDLFQGHKTANKVEPMGEDFIFNSWGVPNSESTAHVIIALCNMGIDPFSDYRFSRGPNDNMIVNWVNRFVTNNRDGFGHTDNRYNGIGTEQGMYALQCYINFKENGGKKPYSLWYDGVSFNFGEQNMDTEPILSFKLMGYDGEISHLTNTITIIIEDPVSIEELKNLQPEIKLGENYTIEGNLDRDFTKDIVYNIKDKDGKNILYNVNIINGSTWFNKFILRGVDGKIDRVKNQIKFEFPYGTYVENLLPNFVEIQPKDKDIKLIPDINTPLDFSAKESFTYTIDNVDNGRKVEYEIILDYGETKGDASIREFSIGKYKAQIQGKSINIALPENMTKEEFISKNKNTSPVIKGYYETIDPSPNLDKNSIDNYLQDYILTDEEGNVSLYNIKFVEKKADSPIEKPEEKPSNKPKDSELIIESFKIGNIEAEIDNEQGIIYIELPYELDLSYVFPIITLSKGSIYPSLEKPLDLRKPIIYTLCGDGEIKNYKLKINILPPKPATKLWEYLRRYSEPEDYQIIIGGEN